MADKYLLSLSFKALNLLFLNKLLITKFWILN